MMMLSRKQLRIGTLAVVVVGLATGTLLAGRFQSQEKHRTAAFWKEVYKTPRELVHGVDAVVLATAVDIRPGRIATSENREDALRFELIDFDVVRGLKGVKDGERITLERAAESESGVFLDVDGGAFELDQSYLLFLKWKEDGDPAFYQVNHQGRFRVANNRLMAADPEDPVAAQLQYRPVEKGLEMVRASLRQRVRHVN